MNLHKVIDRVKPVQSLVLIIVSAILFTPFIFIVSIALSSDQTSRTSAFTVLPHEWDFGNFVRAFTELPIGTFLVNSLIIVAFACVGMVFSSAIVAYGFARLRAPGKNVLFIILLATMMIPSQVLMIPQFVIFKNLGWIDTLLPLIVPNFFAGAYNVFLMRQFITAMPMELDEAAKLDGVSYFGVFRRIIFPLMRPVLVAVAVFTFSFNWGDFMGPLIYINSQQNQTLALGLQLLTVSQNPAQPPPWNMVMVGALILTVPMLLTYILGQRHIYEIGLLGSSGGAK